MKNLLTFDFPDGSTMVNKTVTNTLNLVNILRVNMIINELSTNFDALEVFRSSKPFGALLINNDDDPGNIIQSARGVRPGFNLYINSKIVLLCYKEDPVCQIYKEPGSSINFDVNLLNPCSYYSSVYSIVRNALPDSYTCLGDSVAFSYSNEKVVYDTLSYDYCLFDDYELKAVYGCDLSGINGVKFPFQVEGCQLYHNLKRFGDFSFRGVKDSNLILTSKAKTIANRFFDDISKGIVPTSLIGIVNYNLPMSKSDTQIVTPTFVNRNCGKPVRLSNGLTETFDPDELLFEISKEKGFSALEAFLNEPQNYEQFADYFITNTACFNNINLQVTDVYKKCIDSSLKVLIGSINNHFDNLKEYLNETKIELTENFRISDIGTLPIITDHFDKSVIDSRYDITKIKDLQVSNLIESKSISKFIPRCDVSDDFNSLISKVSSIGKLMTYDSEKMEENADQSLSCASFAQDKDNCVLNNLKTAIKKATEPFNDILIRNLESINDKDGTFNFCLPNGCSDIFHWVPYGGYFFNVCFYDQPFYRDAKSATYSQIKADYGKLNWVRNFKSNLSLSEERIVGEYSFDICLNTIPFVNQNVANADKLSHDFNLNLIRNVLKALKNTDGTIFVDYNYSGSFIPFMDENGDQNVTISRFDVQLGSCFDTNSGLLITNNPELQYIPGEIYHFVWRYSRDITVITELLSSRVISEINGAASPIEITELMTRIQNQLSDKASAAATKALFSLFRNNNYFKDCKLAYVSDDCIALRKMATIFYSLKFCDNSSISSINQAVSEIKSMFESTDADTFKIDTYEFSANDFANICDNLDAITDDFINNSQEPIVRFDLTSAVRADGVSKPELVGGYLCL